MVRLVAVTQTLEDLHRLLDAGLLDLHRLETALEGRILLDVLAVLVVRGRADRLELAARQHGLEHLGRVNRALGGTRTHEGVDLVDEQDDVAARADLLEDLLQALLKVAAVARAGDQRPHVEAVNLLVLDGFGHVAVHDRLGEALDDRGLTDAGLTDQDRVVLRAAREDLHDALHLDAAADDGVQLVLARGLRQVAAELLEDRGVGALRTARSTHARTHGLAALLVAALVATEHLDDGLAHLRQVRALLGQHLGGHALALLEEAEQQVLRADVVVAQLQGLAQAQLEDTLSARGEGNVTLDRLLTLADDLNDRGANGLALDTHRLQGLGGDALTLGDQAEQQVLRADVVVLETASLVLREHDDPASAVGKAFEHASPHCAGRALRRARRTPVPVDWLQTTKSAGDVRALSPSAQGRGQGTNYRQVSLGASPKSRT